MKNKVTALTLTMTVLLLFTACQKKQENLFVLPVIPEGYAVDKTLYLAEGDGIYAFIDNKAFDYEIIGAEIINGNAQTVKTQFEESGNSEENPEEYAAVQNILGITEVYLGNYERAFEYFNDTIDFLDKSDIQDKDKILSVLYNNAGAVTVDLYKNATIDKRLGKAAELCREPYMALVIAVNQTGRVKVLSSRKADGEMIVRAKELIKKEAQIDDSPNFVLFSAVRYMAVGYESTSQEKKAIEVLDEYIPLISDGPEYNLIRASLLSFRGYCYDRLGDYESAINDFNSSIISAGKTVDENSRQLANVYGRAGSSYGNGEDWSAALAFYEKAIPGYRYGSPADKSILYWNAGYVSYQLNQFDKAKKYLLKAYINNQMVIEDLGDAVGEEYGNDVKDVLYMIYMSEEDYSISFYDWLEQESEQYQAEEMIP